MSLNLPTLKQRVSRQGGLLNLNNTCYLSSALVFLTYGVPIFTDDLSRNYLLNNYNSFIYGENSVLYHLLKLVETQKKQLTSPIDVTDIWNIFTNRHISFSIKTQHDSEEALWLLLDMIQDEVLNGMNNFELNQRKIISPVNNCFEMKIKNIIRCADNKHCSWQGSEKTDSYYALKVGIPNLDFIWKDNHVWDCAICTFSNLSTNSTCVMCYIGKKPPPLNRNKYNKLKWTDRNFWNLTDLLKCYFSWIKLVDYCNDKHENMCKSTKSCYSRNKIIKLPRMLIIHLVRWEKDIIIKKNTLPIKCPSILGIHAFFIRLVFMRFLYVWYSCVFYRFVTIYGRNNRRTITKIGNIK